MQSVNSVTLIGALGRDPEVRTTQSGKKIATMSVATSETWNDRQSGERKEKTEWHRVVVMNERLADVAEKYLHKGSKAYLVGSLQTRKYTDQSGQEKYATEIILGSFDSKIVLLDSGAQRSDGERHAAPARSGGKQHAGPGSDLDDEIPF